MDREGWRIAGIAMAAAVGVIWTGDWFADRLVPTDYPGELGYRPAGDLPPPVDLAAVQRSWPGGLDAPGERGRLIAYLRDVERQAPPPRPAVATATTAAEPPPDLGTLLGEADAGVGKAKAQVCSSCHDFQQGGPNRIGPNLWGVVGRKVASHPGFSYSPAMAAQTGAWTYDRLFTYLASPARAVPGNKMGFAGLRNPQDRAAVIKYLATLGNAPPPPAPGGAKGQTSASR